MLWLSCVCDDTQVERDAVHVAEEEHVATYLELQQQLAAAKAAMRAVVNQPRYILPFLQPGRLVNIAASASGTSLCPTMWSRTHYSCYASIIPHVLHRNQPLCSVAMSITPDGETKASSCGHIRCMDSRKVGNKAALLGHLGSLGPFHAAGA